MDKIYTDMEQCGKFFADYFDGRRLEVRAHELLLSKDYDSEHREFLEPLGSRLLHLVRDGDDEPGWWRIEKIEKKKRMSKKGMTEIVEWAMNWALHPSDDELAVKREMHLRVNRRMERTWPGLSFILVKENEVVCTLRNGQVFSIKITIPRSLG